MKRKQDILRLVQAAAGLTTDEDRLFKDVRRTRLSSERKLLLLKTHVLHRQVLHTSST